MTHTQLGERADATSTARTCTYLYTRRLYSVRLLQLRIEQCSLDREFFFPWTFGAKMGVSIELLLLTHARNFAYEFARSSFAKNIKN